MRDMAAKLDEARSLAKAAARMRARIDDLSRAIRRDLDALGLAAALPDFAGSHSADDRELAAYPARRRGWGGRRSRSSYPASGPPRRDSLEIPGRPLPDSRPLPRPVRLPPPAGLGGDAIRIPGPAPGARTRSLGVACRSRGPPALLVARAGRPAAEVDPAEAAVRLRGLRMGGGSQRVWRGQESPLSTLRRGDDAAARGVRAVHGGGRCSRERARAMRLTAALRRHRKQARLTSATLLALRQLELREVAG
jgi:hypothetical protein